MPEGPEVKTVAKTLAHNLVGKHLGVLWHSSLRLRGESHYDRLKLLEQRIISAVESYGKVLFISVNNKPSIMAQLGMTGQLKVEKKDAPLMPHTHVRWELLQSPFEIRYVDPRRFGLFAACDDKKRQEIITRLGPDPFNLSALQEKEIISRMAKSKRVIKQVLLDQAVIAGVGNIYASEALFLAHINPLTRACDINNNNYKKLIKNIIHVLQLAYSNSGTSFSNYVDGTGVKGNNLGFLKVFQRHLKPCFSCQRTIQRITQGGRSSFYCPRCQPLK
jgi:formamidopyrimidine-DNA glycosylase